MTMTFRECVILIEKQLGLRLLDWQIDALQMMYENEPFYCYPRNRGCGITLFKKAAKLLEEIKEQKDV